VAIKVAPKPLRKEIEEGGLNKYTITCPYISENIGNQKRKDKSCFINYPEIRK
jgi:hypothetical protein